MIATIKPSFLVYDTLDDRREIHTLLSRLHPRMAVNWLEKLCLKAVVHGARPGPSRAMRERVEMAIRKGGEHHRRLVNEIYMDVWMLCSQHGLNIDEAVRNLEELAKKQKG
ncbi:hypothetical protein [Zavarzinella formosa]|uniref:hypothetical protein n=1 Tax=Zavarzinella formosa TaxID=360055 RepID=UPI000300915C|nr:hypothetical protein [Zavarzinella formosa]